MSESLYQTPQPFSIEQSQTRKIEKTFCVYQQASPTQLLNNNFLFCLIKLEAKIRINF